MITFIMVFSGYFYYDHITEAKIGRLFSMTNNPLNIVEMRKTISDSVAWFKNAQEGSGHFKYEYIPFLDRYTDDDHMVRQAGALYELGEILFRDTENTLELQGTVENAIDFMEENTVGGQFNDKRFKCVLVDNTRCALGGTSLAFIGILDFVQKYPKHENDYEDLLDEYLDYFIAMKKEGEGFIDHYYLDGRFSDSESDFSNGEVFLALVRYYKYNPTDEVKKIIDDSFNYFNEKYRERWDASFYLWGMAALKDLYVIDPRPEYYNFAKDYTDWRISAYKHRRNITHNMCAYIEGVVSAYSVISAGAGEEEKAEYLEEIDYWLTKSKDLQVQEEDFIWMRVNALPAKLSYLKNTDKAVGGFLTDLDEPVQRIDFTQHCVSSYLQKLVDIDGQKL